ncbi:MAG: hypothetical protein AB8B55_09650 [Mariniblastus sp.]
MAERSPTAGQRRSWLCFSSFKIYLFNVRSFIVWFSVGFALIGLALFPLTSSAQTALPKGAVGHTVQMDSGWCVADFGYQPIKFTITNEPAVALPKEQRFTVSISYRIYRRSPTVAVAEIVIPAGATSGSVELYADLSQRSKMRSGKILVERDGYDGRYDLSDLLQASLNRASRQYIVPTTLLVSSKELDTRITKTWTCVRSSFSETAPVYSLPQSVLPSFEKMQKIYSSGNVVGIAGAINKPAMTVAQTEQIHSINPDGLPEKWIGLTSASRIMISLPEFDDLCRQNPVQRSNIEKWVASGGLLMILDAGKDLRKADQVWARLLGPERQILGDRKLTDWIVPGAALSNSKKLLPTTLTEQNFYYGNSPWYAQNEDTSSLDGDWESFDRPSDFISKTKFGLSNYLNGQIAVVQDNMASWEEQDWRVLHNTVAKSSRGMPLRIGISTGDFALDDFVIPGVGEPPVGMFQFLIGLFLLLAGPVALIVLKRTENMQLLFIAVPLLSIGFCFSLFGYAILVDGTQKWGRSQTYTTLDHRTNLAVTHTRATYYTGSAPGNHEFSNQTAVFSATDRSNLPQVHRFNDDGQEISGGNIRPRTPHEMVTINAQPALQRLVLVKTSGGQSATDPTIQNRLGADVATAIIRTEAGFFIVEELAADGVAQAKPINETEANDSVSELVNTWSPQRIRGGNYIGYVVNFGDRNWGEESFQIESFRRKEATDTLKPNSYIAFLKQFPLATKQLKPVEYKMEIHVVRGQW